ncbi:MAG: hypothetical protein LBQ79_07450 [Deltaproteobacteria bacterium]|jgi:hypothetical protein|nr:hypothetical protein [Deltaproteobacteria bacterium]
MTPDRHLKDARHFRPSLIGSWFLFAGLLMGPAIILFDRDPEGRKMLWIVMTVFFLGLILHRAGMSYRMDGRALSIRRWWGILGETVIPYGEISQVEVKRSFASSVAGRGHVLLATGGGAWETLLSQKDPEALQDELERLRGEASVPGLGFTGEDAGGGDHDAGAVPGSGLSVDDGPSLDADDAAERENGSGGPVETGPSLDTGEEDAPPDGGPDSASGPEPPGAPAAGVPDSGRDGPGGGEEGV